MILDDELDSEAVDVDLDVDLDLYRRHDSCDLDVDLDSEAAHRRLHEAHEVCMSGFY